MPKRIKRSIEKAYASMPFKTGDGTLIFFVLSKRKVAVRLNKAKGPVANVITYNKEDGVIRIDMSCEKPPFRCYIYCYPDHLRPAVTPEAKAVAFVDENFVKKGDVDPKEIENLKLYNLTNEFRVALKKMEKEKEDDASRDDTTGSEDSTPEQSEESDGHGSVSSDSESDSSRTTETEEERTQ